MINNEIYNLKDISQYIAVIMNIDNQNFLYKIEENAYIPISDNIANFLKNEKIILTAEELELVGNIKGWINKQVKDSFAGFVSNTYILKLIPTLRCNLNCSYCFAKEKSSDFDMNVETAKTAIDFFLNYFQLLNNCTYIVDLSGAGEPLLRLDFILEVNKYVKEIESRKKIHIFCQLVTNGMLLTPEISKIIQENGIIFGVSLDGDKNLSENRKGLDYAFVEKNINEIKYKDFFGLAATYDGKNNDILSIFKSLDRFKPSVIGIKPVRQVFSSDKAINGEDYFARFLIIAHLQYQNGSNHFVVISKINEKRVWVYDPAIGKVFYKKEEFLKIWSGYIILVSPSPDFVVQKGGHPLLKFVPLIIHHVKLLAFMVFISVILSMFGILSGLYFKFFVDDIIGSKAQISLHVLSFALVSLTVFSSILTVCRSQILRIFTMKTDISLSISYIKHVLHLPINFFYQNILLVFFLA